MQMQTSERKSKQKCPDCGGFDLEKTENGLICNQCGYVITQATINLRKKEKALSISQQEKMLPRLTTDESIDKRKLPSVLLTKLDNIRIADAWEKNFLNGLKEIARVSFSVAMPEITVQESALLYKTAVERGLSKGRSRKTLCATLVYLCAEKNNLGVTIKDIARISDVPPRKIIYCYRRIAKLLGFSILPQKVDSHINELSYRLKLSCTTIELAKKIYIAIEQNGEISGKDPCGLGAAIIYLSALFAGEKVTQREISNVSNLTETTIRSRFREIRKYLAFNFTL